MMQKEGALGGYQETSRHETLELVPGVKPMGCCECLGARGCVAPPEAAPGLFWSSPPTMRRLSGLLGRRAWGKWLRAKAAADAPARWFGGKVPDRYVGSQQSAGLICLAPREL